MAIAVNPNPEIADWARRFAELEAKFTLLLAENVKLKEENAELKRRLGMDSSNSSKPPSTNSPFKRPPPQPPSGKKPGGQPGHKGNHRQLSETVDQVDTCAPHDCKHCGEVFSVGDLVGAPLIHEIIEVEVKHHVRRIELHAARCPKCRKTTRAPLPAGTPSGNFGPNVHAIIALMTVRGVSRSDIQKLFKALFDIDISIGSIDNACTRVHESAEDAIEQIFKFIEESGVAHADETGWHVRGKLGWMWGALVAGAELFRFDPKRNRDALRELVGKFSGILHSDRWGPYKLFSPENRQLCHSHLRRDLQAIIDAGGEMAEMAKKMLALSDEMFAIWHSFERDELDVQALETLMEPVKDGWQDGATTMAAGEKGKARALGKSMLALWPALWNFLVYEGVQPTNNAEEQAMRTPVKIRKNAFGSTSNGGAQRMAGLLTVAGTAKRQNINLFKWLVHAMECKNRGLPAPTLLWGYVSTA